MTYTTENAPTGELPKEGVKLWVKIFNAVFADTKDDNKARQAAWGGVKNKWRKVGDKWIKKIFDGIGTYGNPVEKN